LFDSHIHFTAAVYARKGSEAPLRARAAGVGGAVSPAVDLPTSQAALVMQRRYPWMLPCLGVHPLYLGDLREPPEAALRALAAQGPFAAVGEVGLDFGQGRGDAARQCRFLAAQAALAVEWSLPLVLHLHKAFYEGFAVLREVGFEGPVVCHGFTGSQGMARLALDRNGYLGAGAGLLRRNARRLRELFAWAPRDRVLVETDAPPPAGNTAPGRQPWELRAVVEGLARVWKVPPEEVAERTQGNAFGVFGVDTRA